MSFPRIRFNLSSTKLEFGNKMYSILRKGIKSGIEFL